MDIKHVSKEVAVLLLLVLIDLLILMDKFFQSLFVSFNRGFQKLLVEVSKLKDGLTSTYS